jgi:hypothetical protein
MTVDEWLTSIPIKKTPRGARLDLRVYVYPDGHGNFLVEDENGAVVPEGQGQPVNNPAEAHEVLEKIWNRAMKLKPEAGAEEPRQPTLAEQFADVIGTVPDFPKDMAAQHDYYIHGVPKS